jgi:hypothetical protein
VGTEVTCVVVVMLAHDMVCGVVQTVDREVLSLP